MLVLTRTENDEIVIPSLGIKLQVLSIRGKNVRLGIVAPQEVSIIRGELSPSKSKQRSKGKGAASSISGSGDQGLPLGNYLKQVGQCSPESVPSSGVDYSVDQGTPVVRERGVGYEVCV